MLKWTKLINPLSIFSVSDLDVYITDPETITPDFQDFTGMYELHLWVYI